MKITVQAHPNSKKPRIQKDLFGGLHIYVKELALENKANLAVIEALAKYLKVKKNHLELVSGCKSKIKSFNVLGV